MCDDDASKYNHCAYCGATFQSQLGLQVHLDLKCSEEMIRDMNRMLER